MNILNVVKKGDLTTIYLEDGSFYVCTGLELFEAPEVVDVSPKKEKPVETKKDEPEVVDTGLAEEEEEEEEKPKAKDDEEEEEADDYWTVEDVEELNRKELIELIEDEELDIDPEEFASVSKLRKEVIEELGL